MANVFDQFDVTAPSATKPATNVFDQFDAAQQTGPKIASAPQSAPTKPAPGAALSPETLAYMKSGGNVFDTTQQAKEYFDRTKAMEARLARDQRPMYAPGTYDEERNDITHPLGIAAGLSPLELLGASPKGLQTAADYYTAKLPQSIQPAAKMAQVEPLAVDKTIAGFADWATTPSGYAQLEAAGLPVAKIPMAVKFFHDMAKGAGESASAMVDAWNQGDYQGFADQLVGTIANTLGAGAIGYHGARKGVEYASRKQEAATVHGDVRPQPKPAVQLPTQEGGQGVQPQAQEVAQKAKIPLNTRLEYQGPSHYIIELPTGERREFRGSVLQAKEELHRITQRGKVSEPQIDKSKPHLVASAVKDPQTGTWFQGANHPSVEKYLGLPKTEKEARNTEQYGFVVQMPDGTRRVATRKEATDIAKASGQNIEDIKTGHDLHSDEAVSPFDEGKAMGDVKQPVEQVDLQKGAVKPMSAPTPTEKAVADIAFSGQHETDLGAVRSREKPLTTQEGVSALVNDLRKEAKEGGDLAGKIGEWTKAKEEFKKGLEEAKKTGDFNKISMSGHKLQLANEALDVIAKFGQREFPPEVVREAQKAMGYATGPEIPEVKAPPKLRPAFKVGKRILTGNGPTHAHVFQSAPQEIQDELLLQGDLEPFKGFVDESGKWYSRKEGGAALGLNKDLISEDMKLKHPGVLKHEIIEPKEAEVSAELDPEHQKMLDIERGNVTAPVEVMDTSQIPSDQPFSKSLQGGVATIDRKTGRILLNKQKLDGWLNTLPAHQKQAGMRSVLAHENIHLAVTDKMADEYWKTLTGLEQAINKRRYWGKGEPAGMNDTMWGHEALRFRIEQAIKATPMEFIDGVRSERITARALTLMENFLRKIREVMKTKASQEGMAMVDKALENVRIGKIAESLASGTTPMAWSQAAQQASNQEADRLEEQARMMAESGDPETSRELMAEAYRIRDQARQQEFPMARPKKRPESIWQEKFVLPGMETQKVATGEGTLKAAMPEGEIKVPTEERVSAESSGALRRLTANELMERPSATDPSKKVGAIPWMKDKISNLIQSATEKEKGGKGVIQFPKFEDFTAFMKRQQAGIQPGQLFEMWQDLAANQFDDLSGEQLQKIGKAAFVPRTSLERIKQLSKTPKTIGEAEEIARKQESLFRRESGRTIWDRPVPDKPAPGGPIDKFRRLEADLHKEMNELEDIKKQQQELPGIPFLKDEAAKANENIKDLKHQVVVATKDYKAAQAGQRWRERVISALFRKMVKPVMEEADARVNRKEITPDEIRYGDGEKASAYEDVSKVPVDSPRLGEMLVDRARRSRDDSPSITRRVTAIQNKHTGTVHIVSTYDHPGRGVVLRDPISPTGEHSKLNSIAKRYRILYTTLLDEPVRKFIQNYKNLPDYVKRFGNDARRRFEHETGPAPATSMTEEQFMEETPGRIEGGAGGSFQGPHKAEIETAGEGVIERSGRVPMTQPEARSILNYVVNELGGDPGTSDDVREALMSLKDNTNFQVLSGVKKLARGIWAKNRNLSLDELLQETARKIYENHKEAKSLQEFVGATMAESRPKAGEAAGTEPEPTPTEGGLTVYERTSPTAPYHEWHEPLPPGIKTPDDLSAKLPEILTKEDLEYISRQTEERTKLGKPAGSLGQEPAEVRPKPEPAPVSKTGRVQTMSRIERIIAKKTGIYSKRFIQEAIKRRQLGSVPREFYPMARPKTPAENYRDQARKLSDDLFRLNTQSLADVEEAFPKMREVGEQYETMPADASKAVYQKIEEEVVKGKSDIQLTGNEQKLYDDAAAIHAENKAMYEQLKELNIPVSEQTIFPRLAKDVNSLFQRMARGVKRSITEGTVLSRAAWFTKHRVIKAIVDNQGNRYPVAIVAGDKGGKVVLYDQGKGVDMGPFAWSDIVRRHQLMTQELEPIDREAEELFKERSILTKTEGIKESAQRRLKNIDKRMAELHEERRNVVDYYPLDDLDQKVWVDKNGRQWRLTDATTAEIESNMDVRYYKEPFSVLTAQNLKLKQMLRAAKWLENFKNTPQFNQIARHFEERNLPPDWKRTDLPQLRDYVFEPRVADVLNQFHERSKGQTPNILTSTNRLLMNAVFFDNPFLHSPNLAAWWFTSRGAMAWANPGAYFSLVKTGMKAFRDVSEKTPEYVNYLRAGTPLQNTRARAFTENITKMLQDELDTKPTLYKRMSNFLGYANPIKLSQSIGHAATSGLHDILTLQLIYELQGRDPSLKPHEAIRKIAAVMPDYRIPARVMGSRWISKVVSSPNAVWFGAYHYSEGKAFSNMAKGLAGRGDLTRGEALDKIAATMFLMAVAYPIMDELLKKITGRKDLMFRRAGPTTMLTAARDVMTGKRTIEQVTPSFVSPAAATQAAISLFFNKNLMFGGRGLPIYNPRQGLGQSLKNIAGFAGQSLNPIQIYRDISMGRYDWDQIFENLAGIRKDYSSESGAQLYGWAYDWAKRTGNQKLMHQFEQRGNEIFPPSDYSVLKNALRDGNKTKAQAELVKLRRIGKSDDDIERELRPGTHPFSGLEETEPAFQASLSPHQRAVYSQAMATRDKIYREYLQLSR
jgi:hypothetical protein